MRVTPLPEPRLILRGDVVRVQAGDPFAGFFDIGARVDHLGASSGDDGTGGSLNAQSAYLEFFPSEFSKLMAMFEQTTQSGVQLAFPDLGPSRQANRILLQATFALGPHKPHPF